MNLLGRFIRFLAISILNLVLSLSVVIFRIVLLPLILSVLRLLWSLVFMSFTASVHGPRQFTDRTASEWTRRLLEMGIPREYIDQAKTLCQVIIFSLITIGWLISALFTVAVVRVVFGFFI